MKKSRLAELIDSYLAQRIDAVGKFELEEALRESAEARSEFWKRAGTEGLLHEWGRTQNGVDPASRTLSMVPQRGWWRSHPWRAIAGIAAAVTFAALFWIYQTQDRVRPAESDSVAVLTQVSDARWGPGVAKLEAGQLIGSGDLALESGSAVLEFVSGSELIITGPAKLRISAANEIVCQEGSLTIHQPTQSARFVVHTPNAVIDDIFQSVALKLGPDATDLLVDKGRASWRLENGSSSSVHAGESLRIGHNGAIEKPSGLQEDLTRQLQLGEQLRASSRNLPGHWLATSKRQNQHPDLLLRYTFDDISPELLRVPNQAAQSRGLLDGTIGGGMLNKGRWPYKNALALDRRFDGVRLNVPGTYQETTMMAWIRIDALDNKLNGLFLSDGSKLGGFHWHILNSGALRVGVTGQSLTYQSPPVITPDTFGKWLHVAVTYDLHSREVSHYFNGRLASREKLKEFAAVEIRSAMIGNWDPLDSKDTDMIRNFHGRVDDFSIYRRALSADEIQRLYEEGRN